MYTNIKKINSSCELQTEREPHQGDSCPNSVYPTLSHNSIYYEEHPLYSEINEHRHEEPHRNIKRTSCGNPPVEINDDTAVNIDLPPILWHGYDITPKILSVINTGQTVLINGQWARCRPYIEGGPLNGSYIFSQIHFHSPSEHEIDGRRYPLEMHVVHYKTCYLTQERAMEEKDGTVVLVYLFQVVNSRQTVMSSITNLARYIERENDRAELYGVVLNQLLQPFASNYYLYWGSVCTNRNSYLLQWIISCSILYVTQEELDSLIKIMCTGGFLSERQVPKMNPVNDVVYHVGEDDYGLSGTKAWSKCHCRHACRSCNSYSVHKGENQLSAWTNESFSSSSKSQKINVKVQTSYEKTSRVTSKSSEYTGSLKKKGKKKSSDNYELSGTGTGSSLSSVSQSSTCDEVGKKKKKENSCKILRVSSCPSTNKTVEVMYDKKEKEPVKDKASLLCISLRKFDFNEGEKELNKIKDSDSKVLQKRCSQQSKSSGVVKNSSKVSEKISKVSEKNLKDSEKNCKESVKNLKDSEKNLKNSEKNCKESEKNLNDSEKNLKESEKNLKDSEKNCKESEKNAIVTEKNSKESEKSCKVSEKSSKVSEKSFKQKKKKCVSLKSDKSKKKEKSKKKNHEDNESTGGSSKQSLNENQTKKKKKCEKYKAVIEVECLSALKCDEKSFEGLSDFNIKSPDNCEDQEVTEPKELFKFCNSEKEIIKEKTSTVSEPSNEIKTIFEKKRSCKNREPVVKDCTVNFLLSPNIVPSDPSYTLLMSESAIIGQERNVENECSKQVTAPAFETNSNNIMKFEKTERDLKNQPKELCLQTEIFFHTENQGDFSACLTQDYNVAIIYNRNVLQEFKGTFSPKHLELGSYEKLELLPKYPDAENFSVHLQDCFVKKESLDGFYIRARFLLNKIPICENSPIADVGFCENNETPDIMSMNMVKSINDDQSCDFKEEKLQQDAESGKTENSNEIVLKNEILENQEFLLDMKNFDTDPDLNEKPYNLDALPQTCERIRKEEKRKRDFFEKSEKKLKDLFYKRKKTVYFICEKIEKDENSGKKIFVGSFRTKDEIKALSKDRTLHMSPDTFFPIEKSFDTKKQKKLFLLSNNESDFDNLIRIGSHTKQESLQAPNHNKEMNKLDNTKDLITLHTYKSRNSQANCFKNEGKSIEIQNQGALQKSHVFSPEELNMIGDNSEKLLGSSSLNSDKSVRINKSQIAIIIIPIEGDDLSKIEVILIEHLEKNKNNGKECKEEFDCKIEKKNKIPVCNNEKANDEKQNENNKRSNDNQKEKEYIPCLNCYN